MAQFNVQKFAADPSAELASIPNAKKQELLELASHLSIATRSSMRKKEIRILILGHYMHMGKLANEARQYITREPAVLAHEQQLEYERISLEHEKLAAQKLESERQFAVLEKQAEEKQLESDRQFALLEKQAEEKRLEYERLAEAQRLESERQMSKFKLEFEIEKAKLQLALERDKEKMDYESSL
ncbi:calponin homology domain-containing protein DDB_G0272472-like [Palaemon carinicauda]|uniref:calponin homology domain-containing protein DDB_G0272472-like n=1 Tax=Palaemon carinicauda TaxID=392227 RepID=UPI0035B658C5